MRSQGDCPAAYQESGETVARRNQRKPSRPVGPSPRRGETIAIWTRLKDLIKKTSSEITELTRVSRIEPLATEKLGLQRTNAEDIFTIVIEKPQIKREGIDNLLFTLQNLADHLPIVTESKAETLKIFDSNDN